MTPEELLEVVGAIRDVLWPPEDVEAPWSADTLDAIAAILTAAGLGRPEPLGPPFSGWIGADPAPADPCGYCHPHPAIVHVRGDARCTVEACGCAFFERVESVAAVSGR